MRVDLIKLHNLAEAARARAQTAQQQRTGRSWYKIENKGGVAGDDVAMIHLYDTIGEWGVTAADFVNDLRGITAKSIELHVNCEGGEVFDGLAIYETLARHPASIVAHVDGVAASAASFVVCAAEKVIIAPRARMMIHDAHGIVMGNARDMVSMATLLDELSDTIADIYADKAGGDRAQWRAAMQAGEGGPDGTWYDAERAVRAGLADEIAAAGAGRPRAELPPLVQDVRPDTETIWNPSALLATVDAIENPPPVVEIPDGQRLRELFDLA